MNRKKEYLKTRLREEYEKKAQDYINSLDFKILEGIKAKEIVDLTNEDLRVIGLRKINGSEEEGLYSFKDFNNIKIYFRRKLAKFEELGFRLRKERDIITTTELLDRTITRWKLKSDIDSDRTSSEVTDEPPF